MNWEAPFVLRRGSSPNHRYFELNIRLFSLVPIQIMIATHSTVET
jgi:hypothetical protein